MVIPVYVGKKLSKETKENIKNKSYDAEQLKSLYQTIVSNTDNAKSGFLANAVIFLLVFGFIAYQMIKIDKKYILVGIAFGVVCYALVMLILYWNTTSAKRQVSVLIKTNYPELYQQIVK